MPTPLLPAIDTYPQPEKLADKYQTHTTGSPVYRGKWDTLIEDKKLKEENDFQGFLISHYC